MERELELSEVAEERVIEEQAPRKVDQETMARMTLMSLMYYALFGDGKVFG